MEKYCFYHSHKNNEQFSDNEKFMPIIIITCFLYEKRIVFSYEPLNENRLVNIKLHGRLGEEVGSNWNFDIRNVAEDLGLLKLCLNIIQ